ncbi:E3 SUMO-protein ligase NSE2 [Microdochium nivale]|nr:E3 SUMO-protein ligase NSE2 [Microdochium nivale]
MPSNSSRRGLLSDSHRNSGSAAGPSASSSTPRRSGNIKRQHQDIPEGFSAATAARGGGGGELPDYEPPSFPLDAKARKALAELSANQDTAGYTKHLTASLEKLSEGVRDINDAYTERRTKLRNHQSRREAAAGGSGNTHQQQQQQDEDDVDALAADGPEKKGPERAEEKAVLFLKGEVPALSEQIEAAVRGVIDMQATLEDGQTALRDAARQAEAESAAVAAKQRERAAARQIRLATREAARAASGAGNDDDDNDDEGEGAENAEDDDLDDAEMQDDITGPLLMVEEAKHRMAGEYEAKSMHARYGTNNEYIAFKKLWHDAVHGSEGKPLPDASRWFREGTGQGQQRSKRQRAGDDEDNDEQDEDDDDDLVIDQEHVSLHCPLSLQIMKDPHTSRKCRHTFEKDSIRQFLGRGTKLCPQTGCSEMVSFEDFYPDQIMLRRIQRAEASNNDTMMMDDDDDDNNDNEEQGDGYDDEPTMASVTMTQERAVKTERSSDRRRRRAEDVDEEDDE